MVVHFIWLTGRIVGVLTLVWRWRANRQMRHLHPFFLHKVYRQEFWPPWNATHCSTWWGMELLCLCLNTAWWSLVRLIRETISGGTHWMQQRSTRMGVFKRDLRNETVNDKTSLQDNRHSYLRRYKQRPGIFSNPMCQRRECHSRSFERYTNLSMVSV